MSKTAIAITALIGTALSASALAKPSSPSELTGFDSCKDQIERELKETRGVVFAPVYYLADTEAGRRYFINLSNWENGDRATLRSECDTNRNGRKVLALNTEHGKYKVSRGRVTIEVAAR